MDARAASGARARALTTPGGCETDSAPPVRRAFHRRNREMDDPPGDPARVPTAVAVRDPLPRTRPRPPSPGIAAVLGVLETLDRQGSAGLADLCSATGL